MMVALLLYAYRSGVYSSRRIARSCEERLDFQAVTALNQPDFRTISEFRQHHLDALSGLFVQVLTICRKAGLAGLEHVAVDGTKIKANASKHQAMSYARMVETEAELAREVAEWLARAQAEDAAEDAEHGSTRRGDEPPDWMRDKQARLAEAARPAPPRDADGAPKPRPGRPPAHPPGQPKPSAQRNFTDPDSRIMKGRDGFVQAYDAQAAVDADAQIIVAHRLTNHGSDQDALLPLLDTVQDTTGDMPDEVSADNGFCSEANLAGLVGRTVRGYVAAGRASKPGGGKKGGPLVQAVPPCVARSKVSQTSPKPLPGQASRCWPPTALVPLVFRPSDVALMVMLQQNLPLFKRLAVTVAAAEMALDDGRALLRFSRRLAAPGRGRCICGWSCGRCRSAVRWPTRSGPAGIGVGS